MITNTEQCLHQLVFALKLKGCIENRVIPKSSIDVDFKLNSSKIWFEANTWESNESMELLAYNNVNLSISGLAIAADAELDETLGNKDPAKINYPFNVRAVVYQVRNCFAHNLLHPTYRVAPKYHHVYKLNFLPSPLSIDFKVIDNRPFSYEHFNGFDNFWKIFEEVKNLIKQK